MWQKRDSNIQYGNDREKEYTTDEEDEEVKDEKMARLCTDNTIINTNTN